MDFEIFNMLDIEKIECQKTFLQQYEAVSGFPSDISVKFDRLSFNVAKHFTTAQLLTWFCNICKITPDIVNQWRNVTDIMKTVLTFYSMAIEDKLETCCVTNPSYIANEIIDIVGVFCFEQLATDKIIVNKNDMITLTKKCSNVCPNQDIESLLSRILVYKITPNGSVVRELAHKSHQEAFAAQALMDALKRDPSKSVEEVVCKLSHMSDQEIMEKYV